MAFVAGSLLSSAAVPGGRRRQPRRRRGVAMAGEAGARAARARAVVIGRAASCSIVPGRRSGRCIERRGRDRPARADGPGDGGVHGQLFRLLPGGLDPGQTGLVVASSAAWATYSPRGSRRSRAGQGPDRGLRAGLPGRRVPAVRRAGGAARRVGADEAAGDGDRDRRSDAECGVQRARGGEESARNHRRSAYIRVLHSALRFCPPPHSPRNRLDDRPASGKIRRSHDCGGGRPRTHPVTSRRGPDGPGPPWTKTRMKSRLSRLGALTVAACLGLLGCEHWRMASATRRTADDRRRPTTSPYRPPSTPPVAGPEC